MEATPKPYVFSASLSRIQTILDAPAGSFEECDSLPPRDQLTYSNGYYANCAALFVDIRRSSTLPEKYKRPRLARIYRSFISEMVATMTSHSQVREVNIVGDCVWSVVNTPYQSHINELFEVAGLGHSLIRVLNHEMTKRGYEHPISVGIGLSYGRALMIKAGYAGSGINDVVYMGDVVNEAAHLASKADTAAWLSPSVALSGTIQANLSDEYKALTEWNPSAQCWASTVISTQMNDWLLANEQG